MNPALLIGIAVSLFLHLGLIFGDKLVSLIFPEGPAVVKVKEEAPKVEIFEMPPLEPPEPEEIVESDDAEPPPEFAPPMLADVPTTVPVSAMTIPFEPPPPEAPKSLGQITIPVTRPSSSSNWGKIFEIRDLDQQPQATYQPGPQYPFEMKRAGQSGTVRLGFLVDHTGTVRDVYVIDSTHRDFEQPAIQAVQKWKFRAGKKSGRAVTTRMEIPIVFNIKDT